MFNYNVKLLAQKQDAFPCTKSKSCKSLLHKINIYKINLKKCSNTKITISHKCANIFEPNYSAHLFTRQLRKSVLFCAVFTWHTPN